MKSLFLRLNVKDFIKGAYLAVAVAIVNFLIAAFKAHTPIDITLLQNIGWETLIAFFSYLLKNLLTNSQDQVLKPEPTNEVKE